MPEARPLAMPPAAPTRTGRAKQYFSWSRSRKASIVGSKVMAGRLSVWPPLSASAVMSSAMGTAPAKRAVSASISPWLTNSRRKDSGGGDMNRVATSTRETLAATRLAANTSPVGRRWRPLTR